MIKKAQMEIMGLLVIVILVTVVLMVVLSMDVTKKDTVVSEKTQFSQEQLTGQLGSTLMETSTTCNKIMRTLVGDCGFSQSITCEGKSSCEYVNNTIEKIVNETLDKAGLKYILTISSDQNTITKITSGNSTGICRPNRAKGTITKSTYIATLYGPMKLDLLICN